MHFSARHVQTQAQDEILAQRLEKVAQRRVEERNEKIKSARASRFDLKLNPFFSRPVESVAKEVERQERERSKPRSRSPTILLRFIPSVFPTPNFEQDQRSTAKEALKKVKKSHSIHRKESNDEGEKTSTEPRKRTAHHHRSATIKRTSTGKSTMTMNTSFSLVTSTDVSTINSSKRFQLIFSSNQKHHYHHLLLIDQIATIFIQVTVLLGQKYMTGGQFRNFAT